MAARVGGYMSRGKGLPKAKEREEVIQFKKDMEEGKINSYDQFPVEFWGLGMLLGVSYLDEMKIFHNIVDLGKTRGLGKDLAECLLSEAKTLIDLGREPEALIIAYWIGKMSGAYQRKLNEAMIDKSMVDKSLMRRS